jgi:hypothetical protein
LVIILVHEVVLVIILVHEAIFGYYPSIGGHLWLLSLREAILVIIPMGGHSGYYPSTGGHYGYYPYGMPSWLLS